MSDANQLLGEARVIRVPQGRVSTLWVIECPKHGRSDEVHYRNVFPRRWWQTKKTAQADLDEHMRSCS